MTATYVHSFCHTIQRKLVSHLFIEHQHGYDWCDRHKRWLMVDRSLLTIGNCRRGKGVWFMSLPNSSFLNIGMHGNPQSSNSGAMIPAISYYFFPGFIGNSVVHLQCTLAFRNAHITKPKSISGLPQRWNFAPCLSTIKDWDLLHQRHFCVVFARLLCSAGITNENEFHMH